MAFSKSAFGKAAGVAASLFGAAAGGAVAQSSGGDAPKAARDAPDEVLKNLRVVIRHAGYAAQRNQILADRTDKSEERLLSSPFAPGLELVVVEDQPSTSRVWMQYDFDRHRLSLDEAMALGRRQVLANLPSIPPKEALAGGVVMVPKMDYLASLMLADGWDELDKALNGNLVVAVPSDDVLIAADITSDTMRDDLRAFVRKQHDDANRSVSPALYQRRSGAWVVAS